MKLERLISHHIDGRVCLQEEIAFILEHSEWTEIVSINWSMEFGPLNSWLVEIKADQHNVSRSRVCCNDLSV